MLLLAHHINSVRAGSFDNGFCAVRILFTATTVLAALHVWRTRGTGSTAPATHTTEADDTKV